MTRQITAAVGRCLLALALCLSVSAQNVRAQSAPPDTPTQLSAPQVRQIAASALQNGDHGLAIQLARGLLKIDARDPFAYFVLASAHGARGEAYLSRRAAGYAFRYSDGRRDKYRASQLAARAAVREERHGLAQLWLRRSSSFADTDGQRAQIAQDYGTLRRLNPWSLRVDLGLRPSNNVNNGSEDTRQIIDGVPTAFVFDGTARALEGLIGTVDLRAGYRWRQSTQSASYLGLRLYSRHVALSSGAQAQAPGARNSDFSSQYLEGSLSHTHKMDTGTMGGSLAFGQAWSGNNRTYHFARATVQRALPVSEATRLSLSAALEERFSAQGTRFDATAVTLTMQLQHRLQSGDRVSLTLGVRDTDAAFASDISQSVNLRAGYRFAEALGPVRLDLGLTLGYADYETALFSPSGRQDKSAYADVTLTFEDWDYAGFSPSLHIRTGRSRSNVSRFNIRELSVGLGFQSKF